MYIWIHIVISWFSWFSWFSCYPTLLNQILQAVDDTASGKGYIVLPIHIFIIYISQPKNKRKVLYLILILNKDWSAVGWLDCEVVTRWHYILGYPHLTLSRSPVLASTLSNTVPPPPGSLARRETKWEVRTRTLQSGNILVESLIIYVMQSAVLGNYQQV